VDGEFSKNACGKKKKLRGTSTGREPKGGQEGSTSGSTSGKTFDCGDLERGSADQKKTGKRKGDSRSSEDPANLEALPQKYYRNKNEKRDSGWGSRWQYFQELGILRQEFKKGLYVVSLGGSGNRT